MKPGSTLGDAMSMEQIMSNNGYEIVEETRRYCRGSLTYKRGRGDGWWFEWIKQNDETWQHTWGGNPAIWRRRQLQRRTKGDEDQRRTKGDEDKDEDKSATKRPR